MHDISQYLWCCVSLYHLETRPIWPLPEQKTPVDKLISISINMCTCILIKDWLLIIPNLSKIILIDYQGIYLASLCSCLCMSTCSSVIQWLKCVEQFIISTFYLIFMFFEVFVIFFLVKCMANREMQVKSIEICKTVHTPINLWFRWLNSS